MKKKKAALFFICIIAFLLFIGSVIFMMTKLGIIKMNKTVAGINSALTVFKSEPYGEAGIIFEVSEDGFHQKKGSLIKTVCKYDGGKRACTHNRVWRYSDINNIAYNGEDVSFYITDYIDEKNKTAYSAFLVPYDCDNAVVNGKEEKVKRGHIRVTEGDLDFAYCIISYEYTENQKFPTLLLSNGAGADSLYEIKKPANADINQYQR